MTDAQDNSTQIYKKLYRILIDIEIDNFYEYLNTLEKVLSLRRQELSKNIDVIDKNLNELGSNDERRKEFINLKVETEQVKGFTNLLRQSFLTSLYSFMELWLKRKCYVDSKRRDGGNSYKTTEGKGINKIKKYFSNIIKSDYPFDSSKDWQWVKKFKRLRDCIVHRQGSLTGFSDHEVDSTLAEFIKREKYISLFGVDKNQIFIDYEFCLKALQNILHFMLDLLSS